MERLARANAIASSDRDSAISTRDVDKAELAQAQSTLAKSKYDLDHSQVRAPFPGRVAQRLINPGEYASAGTAVVRLVDIADVEVSAPAPIAAARYIQPGSPVTVLVAGKPVLTKVRAIVPVGDVNSRTVEVRLVIPAVNAIVGDAVKVLLPSAAPRDVLAVPRDALVLREDNTYVFRVSKESLSERVAVETGSEDGDLVEVTGDLSAGDRVVVKGAERLEPGQKVRATPAS
jgi:RND family efflux transporter MFP subunit